MLFEKLFIKRKCPMPEEERTVVVFGSTGLIDNGTAWVLDVLIGIRSVISTPI